MLCVQLPAPDAGANVDAGTDAGPSVDGGTDAGDRCGVLARPFVCQPVSVASLPAPEISCDSEAVATYVSDCFGPLATSERCQLWIEETPTRLDGGLLSEPCAACLNRWVTPDGYPNSAACHLLSLGGGDAGSREECRNAYGCVTDCNEAACSSALCDTTVLDANNETERDRCYKTTPTACENAMSQGANALPRANACFSDPDFQTRAASCLQITNTRKIELFYRGACRNGGDFSAAATSVD